MDKFKVGDRVKCIDSEVGYSGQGWKKGFIFTITSIRYGVAFGGINDAGVFFSHIELVKKGKPIKEVKTKTIFIAIFDEDDIDTHTTFTNKKELIKWLKEVKENEDINFSSIKVYEIKKEFEVITNFKLKKI